MSKNCNQVKNPCKICLGPVNNKNGLQCHGACESWVHYGCSNYTPGKIKDIKAGVIKVTCPCPDCSTKFPKEFRTDKFFSCANQDCPANMPPKCHNKTCPINANVPESCLNDKRNQTRWPGEKCGTDCKKYSNPNLCENAWPGVKCGKQCKEFNTPLPPPPPQPEPATLAELQMLPTSSDVCYGEPNQCESGCSSDTAYNRGASESMSTGENVPSFRTMEQMCSTVGLLTKQINELMCKMKEVVKTRGGCCPSPRGNCGRQGPRSKCPKPCYCPGNPGR